jgi:hypothetical protein
MSTTGSNCLTALAHAPTGESPRFVAVKHNAVPGLSDVAAGLPKVVAGLARVVAGLARVVAGLARVVAGLPTAPLG